MLTFLSMVMMHVQRKKLQRKEKWISAANLELNPLMHFRHMINQCH